MKHIKLLVTMLMFISANIAAFEFTSTNATYDFTQTVEIFIVDKKGSKLFAMFDPFEMKVTTIPSRFYIAVLGVIERGHRNAEGVTLVKGAVNDYEYAVMFRSLDRSHILLVGENWIVDGSNKIFLLPGEISEIYGVLKRRSDELLPDDLSKFELFLQEISERQGDVAEDRVDGTDIELKSIADARKSIQERLPAGHNDLANLPYYNKALENEQFREAQEKPEKIRNEEETIDLKPVDEDDATRPVVTSDLRLSSVASAPSDNQPFVEIEVAPNNSRSLIVFGFFAIVGVGLLYWRVSK